MYIKNLMFLCLIVGNIAAAQQKDFSLSGRTSNIEEGTYLYFRDLANGGNIDSAEVRSNRFKFTTALPEPVLYVMMFTKDRANFVELWLEDKPMTFDASKGDFKDAKIGGSRSHSLAMKMNNEVYTNVEHISEDELKQREKNFVMRYPNTLASAYILSIATERFFQNEVAELYSGLSQEVRASSIGQKVARYLEKDIAEVGEKFSDFSIPNSEGKIVKISDLRGRLTLLQFWSSGCGFSRKMNKTILSGIYPKYHPAGLEIVNISKDTDKEQWMRTIQEDGLNWPQLRDIEGWNGEAFRAYGVLSTPMNFLINSEGTIVEKNLRGEEVEKKIQKYLAEE